MELSLPSLSSGARISATSFVAARHHSESCGHNGLPLTPNSVSVLGLAQKVRAMSGHPNLAAFLDCARGKHERVVAVSEYFNRGLRDVVAQQEEEEEEEEGDNDKVGEDFVLKVSSQCLSALAFLHDDCGFPHATLELDNVLLSDDGDVKLFNHGLGFMTGYGTHVDFPVFNPRFAAPEVLSLGPGAENEAVFPMLDPGRDGGTGGGDESEQWDFLTQIPEAPRPRYDSKSDLWSLGMVLSCLSLRLQTPWAGAKTAQVVRKVLSFQEFEGDVLERLAKENDRSDRLNKVSPRIRELIGRCLRPRPEDRPSARELLLSDLVGCKEVESYEPAVFPSLKLRCRNLSWPAEDEEGDEVEDEDESPLSTMSVQETYYLWRLAGGDLFGELRKHGLMVTRPPALTAPALVLGEGHAEGEVRERCALFDPVVIPLSLSQLEECLKDITVEDCYPLLLDGGDDPEEDGVGEEEERDETSRLPLVIKESDVRYQFKRLVLYRRLLQGYPYLKSQIWEHARTDIVPHYRAYVWASLLGIEHDTVEHYDGIDKDTWTPTDRQIEVDIPRCHQYNSLLASPEGHRKFKRVLKAWVRTNPHYVYWQGLDSLCAPFLYLNFNEEALAFACFSAFIPKYLYGMFQRDNAQVIQEYLAKFSHLQAFHDAELFNHLDGIGFIPDLYAIPWVLTMFAHVFPLQDIFHLWDKLLLGDSSFPLCIGLAILLQLRERLLEAEFNDCILLFSDLPAVDIERCVTDSVKLFNTTPPSLTWRRFGSAETAGPLGVGKKTKKNGHVANGLNNGVCVGSDDPLEIDSITLAEQRAEKVPRIAGGELLELLGLAKRKKRRKKRNFSGVKKGRQHIENDDDEEERDMESVFGGSEKRCRPLVVDVRPAEEYRVGALPDSLHLPATSSWAGVAAPDGSGDTTQHNSPLARPLPQLAPEARDRLSLGRKGRDLICVAGSAARPDEARDFADRLLRLEYSRLCVLHGGVEIFKPMGGVLCVPDT